MRITCISDTHAKHNQARKDLPGGDLLIHAGDISPTGINYQIENFCKWFDKINNYDHKIFIAGNHDWLFQTDPEEAMQIVNSYKWITYLQDEYVKIGDDIDSLIKIYGMPWMPIFLDWAFNLPKNGFQLKEKVDMIPNDVDILITHHPPFGILDATKYQPQIHLGCETLALKVKEIKPKIHVFGDVHTEYGYYFDGDSHYINASLLDEQYQYTQKPLTIDWNPETNEIEFIMINKE